MELHIDIYVSYILIYGLKKGDHIRLKIDNIIMINRRRISGINNLLFAMSTDIVNKRFKMYTKY